MDQISYLICFALFFYFAWRVYKKWRDLRIPQLIPFKVVKPSSFIKAEHETTERKRVVAVTGGTGFIGSHVVDELVRRGDCHVFVLGRKFRPKRTNPNADCLLQVDMQDLDGLVNAFQGVDSVINTAAIVPNIFISASEIYSKNRTAFSNIMIAARKAGVKTLTHISAFPNESKPKDPVMISIVNIFEIFQKEVIAANGKDGLQTCVIGPGNVLGLNKDFMDKIASGEMKSIAMPDLKRNSFVPVEYVAAAIVNAEKKLSTPGGSEGIAGKFLPLRGEQMSWKDLFTLPGWPQKISPVSPYVLSVLVRINVICATLFGWAPFGPNMAPLLLHLFDSFEAEVPEEEIQEVYRVLEVGLPHPPVAEYVKQMVQRSKDKQDKAVEKKDQ